MSTALSSLSGAIPWRFVSLLGAVFVISELLHQTSSVHKFTESKLKTLAAFHRDFHCPSTKNQIPGQAAAKEEYFALCVFIRNEPQYLPEWLDHHYYHMNISHFYIMDDGSDPPLSTTPNLGSVPRSAITFHHHPRGRLQKRLPQQPGMYTDCVSRHGKKHTWMGFIDVDEFYGIRTTETMENILRELETHNDIGALGVNWKLHTSAGLLERPVTARKGFDVCVDDEKGDDSWSEYVKSIVRTSHFAGPGTDGVHTFALLNGTKTVGEDWKALNATEVGSTSLRIPITRNRLALHHYFLRSKEEFDQKMHRTPGDNPRTWEFWDKWEKEPHVSCTEMAEYDP